MKSSLLFQIMLVTSLLPMTFPGHVGLMLSPSSHHPAVKTAAPPSLGTPNVGIWNDACFASNMTTANPQCAIGGATLTPGSLVTVDINVTNAPAFDGFAFSMFFEQKVLTLHSVNFASGTRFN